MTRRVFLFAVVLLFLLFFATRLHGLLALPLFMDEATHLTRSQAVWQGKPLELLLTGKALGPYLAALLDPFNAAPFVGRFAVLLISLIGVASVAALARMLQSRAAGLVAAALWILSPYMFFFERMALVDTTLASMAALAALCGYRMVRSGKARDAVYCGAALALCAFAKTTGVIFFYIPVAAWVLFRPRRLRQPVIAYIALAFLLAIPTLYILSQSANVFGVGALASTEAATLGDRLRDNPGQIWGAMRDYFTPAAWALLLGCAGVMLIYRFRAGLYLFSLAVAPALLLTVTATTLYLRYLVILLPGLFVMAAVGLLMLANNFPVRTARRLIPPFALGAAALFVALPFFTTAYSDPAALPLPKSDREEYITGWTSGFGLREAARYLAEGNNPRNVTALLASCNSIRLYLPRAVEGLTFNCPNVWEGTGFEDGIALVRESAARDPETLVIVELSGPVPSDWLPQTRQYIAFFQRPDQYYAVVVVRVPPDSSALDAAQQRLYARQFRDQRELP